MGIIFLPFRLVWSLIGFLFVLMGKMLSAIIGIALIIVGIILTVSIVAAIIGVPLVILGFLLLVRSIF